MKIDRCQFYIVFNCFHPLLSKLNFSGGPTWTASAWGSPSPIGLRTDAGRSADWIGEVVSSVVLERAFAWQRKLGLQRFCRVKRKRAMQALYTYTDKKTSDDRPRCLENPRPGLIPSSNIFRITCSRFRRGAESTLTENAASPFQAEPIHSKMLLKSFDRQEEVDYIGCNNRYN
jgi:hypothetical protein